MSLVELDDNDVTPVIDVDVVADCEEAVRLYGATNVGSCRALTAKQRPDATEFVANLDAVPCDTSVTATGSLQVGLFPVYNA
jgi:hypothetical protein